MEEILKQLRKKHLGASMDLDSFTENERGFLNVAFEAGARVMYNLIKNTNPELIEVTTFSDGYDHKYIIKDKS